MQNKQNKNIITVIYFRHVVFAPSAHNAYAGASFPGIVDAMFDIEKATAEESGPRWRLVHKQLAVVTFFIETAAASLLPSTRYMEQDEFSSDT